MGTTRLRAAATSAARVDDAGTIVLGWLTRIVLVAAVIGLIGYDAVAIAQGHVQAADHADQIAQDAHEVWAETHSLEKAQRRAAEVAGKRGRQHVLA